MSTTTKSLVLVVLGVMLGLLVWRYLIVGTSVAEPPLTQVTYVCNGGAVVTAAYYDGPALPPTGPDMPPTPGGRAEVSLDHAAPRALAQTLSADGARYATSDESLVVWNKGDGLIVLEHGEEQAYRGCAGVVDGVWRAPEALTEGTNLSSDTRVTLETKVGVAQCSADLFIDQPTTAETVTEGAATYSVASVSDAAAGNRYEETVYALPGTDPCVAVRYLVHYSVFENYPPGTVRAFDPVALRAELDAVREVLIARER